MNNSMATNTITQMKWTISLKDSIYKNLSQGEIEIWINIYIKEIKSVISNLPERTGPRWVHRWILPDI